MGDGRLLAVGASGDAGAVFAALSSHYTVHAEPARTMTWTWLDTADSRLHAAGVALREERTGRHREIVLDRADAPNTTAAVTGVRWPARLDALGRCAVRDEIAGVVGVRALLPVAEVETRRILLRLMDVAGKTRVRVSVDQQRLLAPRRAPLPLHVGVRALRGYDDDAGLCVRLLADAMGAAPTNLSPTGAALAAAGRLPGAPGPDEVTISPTDTGVRPVAWALLGEVAVVDRSRNGAIADHDPEFLHDLRSALRSTAALLAVTGHLLPGRSAQRVGEDLAWLDEKTAPLRAVDIALLEIGGEGALDVAGIDHTAALREELLRQRGRELRRMRQALRAPRAPAAFTAWQADLRTMIDADAIGPSAAESARTLAAATYRGVVAADPEVLRDRVIAMREVLAAFRAMYSPRLRRVAADLDALHTTIRYRDGLRAAAERIRYAIDHSTMPVETVLAAGALLDRAGRQAAALELEIADRAARFAAPKSARRVAALTT